MTEPDYRSFENKPQSGSYMDDREKQLQAERVKYMEEHPKPWYICNQQPKK